jgi:hypothetical protein
MVFWVKSSMKSAVFLAAIVFVMVVSFSLSALASEQPEPEGAIPDDSNPSLNSTGSDYPLLEKLSDNGNYLVRLAWPQIPLNPDNAFDLQVYFLDPNDPSGTNGTLAEPESNTTGSGQVGGSITVPDTLEHYVDVESYDITIYTGDGSVLWQRLDRPGMAGTPGERVLVGNYTGPVTIDITDIRPGNGTATAGEETDSVKFSASIVPEFPLVTIPLIAAVASIVAMLRFRSFLRLP